MYILGLAGGIDTLESRVLSFNMNTLSHDSAAVLIRDGEVVAAVEEERLNRIKHTNLMPVNAIEFVLDRAGITLSQVDSVAYYLNEEYLKNVLLLEQLNNRNGLDYDSIQDLVIKQLEKLGDTELYKKLMFVDHHVAHAYSSFPFTSFSESLVLVIDGRGEYTAGLVGTYKEGKFTVLRHLSQLQSLGIFYLNITKYLGFEYHDEYKVMGLAPYGDPSRFRDLFKQCYTLKPEGDYNILEGTLIFNLFCKSIKPRQKKSEFEQIHKDLAASLQEALENIVLHVLSYWRDKTSHNHLSVAGGVGHNCSMNGKILNSGIFDKIFVQPAAHDAGCALGAALFAQQRLQGGTIRHFAFDHVFLGPSFEEKSKNVAATLLKWQNWLNFEWKGELIETASTLLAEGKVIGWVQGCSEFGPRALGNRSILADPRPASNKERINKMVKKREGFRPFAPSVIEEEAHKYFDYPRGIARLDFMNFVVSVNAQYREELGAITHVDGSARIQTVAKSANPRFWTLLKAFGKKTGYPILLNTSFNNNVEPIVNSLEDAITSFLTTQLDVLIIDNFVITKKEVQSQEHLNMTVCLQPYVELNYNAASRGSTVEHQFKVQHSFADKSLSIGEDSFRFLRQAVEEPVQVREWLNQEGLDDVGALIQDLMHLWELRFIDFQPQVAHQELEVLEL